MDVIFTHCAGLDGPPKRSTACRLLPAPTGQETEGLLALQTGGTFTLAGLALADWLAAAGMTYVARERPGEYGQPVYHLLEGSYTGLLVHAAHVHNVPGRKTAQAEARWLATLLRYGLLPARVIPPAGQRELRALTRYRTTLGQERRRAGKRGQGVLERAKITLAAGASDGRGGSGRAMLDALSAGRADPATRAELARGRMRSKMPALAQALTGVVRAHHRLLLATPLAPIAFVDEQLAALSRAIVARRAALAPPAAPGAPPGPTEAPSPAMVATPPAPVTFARAIALLDTIPGVDQRGAALRVAALGIDLARWGPAARLAAWSGGAPGKDESAGTQRSGKTRQGNGPWRAGLTQLAPAAARPTGTYRSALYDRLAARRGKKRAIMAVAHSMVVRVCQRLSRTQPYREWGANSFDAHQRQHVVERLTRRRERLGYHGHLAVLPSPAA